MALILVEKLNVELDLGIEWFSWALYNPILLKQGVG